MIRSTGAGEISDLRKLMLQISMDLRSIAIRLPRSQSAKYFDMAMRLEDKALANILDKELVKYAQEGSSLLEEGASSLKKR